MYFMFFSICIFDGHGADIVIAPRDPVLVAVVK